MTNLSKALATVGVIVFLALMLFLVDGLAKSDADRASNNASLVAKLPQNCSLAYLGKYDYDQYNSMPVVFVQCNNLLTTTTTSMRPCGRNAECPTSEITITDTSKIDPDVLRKLKHSIAVEERMKLEAELKVYGKLQK